jgi:acyl dehydratase
VTEGGHGTTVVQPVPVPDGVRYETTVSDAANAAKSESGI